MGLEGVRQQCRDIFVGSTRSGVAIAICVDTCKAIVSVNPLLAKLLKNRNVGFLKYTFRDKLVFLCDALASWTHHLTYQ